MIEITLKDGTKISGSAKQVMETLRKLGIDPNEGLAGSGLYYSETKGVYLAIAEMATRHLRNAVMKFYTQAHKKWLDALFIAPTAKDFLQLIVDGPDVDATMESLLKELSKRRD